MDDAGEDAYAALRAGDWDRLRLLLHPYLHWTGADGQVVRGRAKVMAALQAAPIPSDRPNVVELRDGQVYRWSIGAV